MHKNRYFQVATSAQGQVMRMPNSGIAPSSDDEKEPDAQSKLNSPLFLQRMPGEHEDGNLQAIQTSKVQAKTKRLLLNLVIRCLRR